MRGPGRVSRVSNKLKRGKKSRNNVSTSPNINCHVGIPIFLWWRWNLVLLFLKNHCQNENWLQTFLSLTKKNFSHRITIRNPLDFWTPSSFGFSHICTSLSMIRLKMFVVSNYVKNKSKNAYILHVLRFFHLKLQTPNRDKLLKFVVTWSRTIANLS